MCYIQLTLWNVPAQILVGDSLSLKMRESWFASARFLGRWEYRLQSREAQQAQETKDKISENSLFKHGKKQ